MNRAETAKILSVLRVLYPNGADGTEATVNLWAALFEPYEYEQVWQAAFEACKEWTGYNMPSPAALIKILDSIPSARKAELRHEADQLIRKGSILTLEEFEKASPEIQEHFGSVARLKRIAMMPIEQADRELDRFEKELPNISRKLHSADKTATLKGVYKIDSPKK